MPIHRIFRSIGNLSKLLDRPTFSDFVSVRYYCDRIYIEPYSCHAAAIFGLYILPYMLPGRLRRRVEVRSHEAMDELHRRRQHASGSVQHGSDAQVNAVIVPRRQSVDHEEQGRYQRTRAEQETDIYKGRLRLLYSD